MTKLLLTASFLLLSSVQVLAASSIVKVLDTVVGESGPSQTSKDTFLQKDFPLRIICDLSTGDAVKVQGRALTTDAWVDIYTWATDEAKDIFPTAYWRVIRSTNGAVGASVCKVHNPFNQTITAH